MYSDQTSNKEATPHSVQRDEEDVRKLTSCFSSGLISDPFNPARRSTVPFKCCYRRCFITQNTEFITQNVFSLVEEKVKSR